MMTIDHKLKVGFRKLFPEYADALEAAKSQKEINQLHEKFIQEAKVNLAKVLGKDVSKLTDTDQTAPIALTLEQYEILKNATGDTIKNQLHVIIDGLERLKNMEQDDAGVVTAQIIFSGVAALGITAIAATQSALIVGAVEAAAAYAGVTAATVVGVCAIAVLVIVLILIPILYFMEKPANCIVLLINELDQPLTFLEDYNEHGKPRLMTSPIPKALVIPGVGTYAAAGLIATEKKEMALVGTQYGFVMKYKDKQLAFGVECPLTSIYEDNNCYCSIGQNAEQAANATADHNTQYYEDTKDGVTISIRCNSGSGSIAYYVARAYKK